MRKAGNPGRPGNGSPGMNSLIRMPFGIIGQTNPGMRRIVGFGDRSTGRGTLGGEFGARHAIVTNGDFTVYVCDSAATRPSSQISLGRLVCDAQSV